MSVLLSDNMHPFDIHLRLISSTVGWTGDKYQFWEELL